MDLWAIITGLCAIPKLIDRIDSFFAKAEQAKKDEIGHLLMGMKEKIAKAQTEEEFLELSNELHDLVSRT